MKEPEDASTPKNYPVPDYREPAHQELKRGNRVAPVLEYHVPRHDAPTLPSDGIGRQWVAAFLTLLLWTLLMASICAVLGIVWRQLLGDDGTPKRIIKGVPDGLTYVTLLLGVTFGVYAVYKIKKVNRWRQYVPAIFIIGSMILLIPVCVIAGLAMICGPSPL